MTYYANDFKRLERLYFHVDGRTNATGTLDMCSYPIINLRDPVDDQDLVTKQYATTHINNASIIDNNIDLTNHYVKNICNPKSAYDVPSKRYVKNNYLHNKNSVLESNLDMNNHQVIHQHANKIYTNFDALTKGYLDRFIMNKNIILFNGTLDMKDNNIHVPELPTSDTDLANKNYLLAKVVKLIPRSGGKNLNASLNMNNYSVLNLSTKNLTKKYVDDQFKVTKTIQIDENKDLNMANQYITNVNLDPKNSTSLISKQYINDQCIKLTGGTISQPLVNVQNRNISHVKYPVADDDVITKQFVDEQTVIIGNIPIEKLDMGNHQISNVNDNPTNAHDVVTKSYVDKNIKIPPATISKILALEALPTTSNLSLALIPSKNTCATDAFHNVSYFMDLSSKNRFFIPVSVSPYPKLEDKCIQFSDLKVRTKLKNMDLMSAINNEMTLFILNQPTNKHTNNIINTVNFKLSLTNINPFITEIKLLYGGVMSTKYIYHSYENFSLYTFVFQPSGDNVTQTLNIYKGSAKVHSFTVKCITNKQGGDLIISGGKFCSLLCYNKALNEDNLKKMWLYYSQRYFNRVF